MTLTMSKLAIFVTVLLPSIVIVSTSFWLSIFAIITLALFLPACRFVMPVPAALMLLLYLYFVWFYKDLTIITHVIGVYALFYFLIYEKKLTSEFFLVLFYISGFVAFLQAFSSGFMYHDISLRELIGSTNKTIFSFHSDMNHAFLEKIRPIGIFPSQVYYSQFLFSMVAIISLSGENRKLVMIFFGIVAAILGSTSGLVCVVLLLLLGRSQNGYLAVLACILTIIVIYVLDPSRYAYNYAIHNLAFSLFYSRLLPLLSIQLSNQFGDVLFYFGEATSIIILLVAILVILVILNILVGKRVKKLIIGMAALVIGQFVGQTVGSFYFLITIGIFFALFYEVFIPSNGELDYNEKEI